MGFIRGKEVIVIQNAPLKDPIHYRVMGYDVSLRRSDAALIEVVSAADFEEGTSYLGTRYEQECRLFYPAFRQ